jgi:hypothetical protein
MTLQGSESGEELVDETIDSSHGATNGRKQPGHTQGGGYRGKRLTRT